MKSLSVFLYTFSIMTIVICGCSEINLLSSAIGGSTTATMTVIVSFLNAFGVSASIALCQVGWALWEEGDRRHRPHTSPHRHKLPPNWLK